MSVFGSSRVNVKGLRERLGLNQASFADELNVDERTVRRWEHGKSAPSPMAIAHMRNLTARKRSDTTTEQEPSNESQRELDRTLSSTAPPTLPRRRLPTL